MKKTMAFLLASLCMPTHGYSGNEWLRQAESSNGMRSATAMTYLKGIWEYEMVMGAWGLCSGAPSTAELGQVQKIMIKWLNKNPEKTHKHMIILYPMAVQELYGVTSLINEESGTCPRID